MTNHRDIPGRQPGPVTLAIRAMRNTASASPFHGDAGRFDGSSERPAKAPDADLLALGRTLSALWADETDVAARFGWDAPEMLALEARTDAVIVAIGAATATTLDGVLVKARAVSYCYSGEPFTEATFGVAASQRITGAILRDLLAMGGRS